MLHKCSINCWNLPDNNHISRRSFVAGLKDVGLLGLWLLMFISWNSPWGPSDDEYRRHQLDEAIQHFFTVSTEEIPLSQEHCLEIALDLAEAGVVICFRDRPLEQEVFEYSRSQFILAKTGRRTSNCRFGAKAAQGNTSALHNSSYISDFFPFVLSAPKLINRSNFSTARLKRDYQF